MNYIEIYRYERDRQQSKGLIMKWFKIAKLGLALAMIMQGYLPSAHAANFRFSETFPDGIEGTSTGFIDAVVDISGTFSGDLNNGAITNFSDVTAEVNGSALLNSGNLFVLVNNGSGTFLPGNAVIYLDNSANDVVFASTLNPGRFNFFESYGLSGLPVDIVSSGSNLLFGTITPQFVGVNIPSALNVTLVTPSVPEPSEWAMLLIGFGSMGSAIRRRLAPGRPSRSMN